jgi:hypothetical protein
LAAETHSVYIDANILLSFYDFTSDNLEKLQQLVARARHKTVIIYMPQITAEEYLRNRDGKIAQCLKNFEKESLPTSAPRITQGYKEYELYRNAIAEAAKFRTALLKQIRVDAEGNALQADDLITALIDCSVEIPVTSEHHGRARERRELRRPPGKSDSLGDQIAWECLKDAVSANEELAIVSRDGDGASPLDAQRINSALDAEWAADKGGGILLFTSLSAFLEHIDLRIDLIEEADRAAAVRDLYGSRSYSDTHKAIELLSVFSGFNEEEVDLIASAMILNDQVSDIAENRQLQEFYYQFLSDYGGQLPDNMVRSIEDSIGPLRTSWAGRTP